LVVSCGASFSQQTEVQMNILNEMNATYCANRSLTANAGPYITEMQGMVRGQSDNHSEPEADIRFTMVHLGAALNDGSDINLLKDDTPVGTLLSMVIDPRGCLKTLGPWAAPINGDLIITHLHVAERARSQGLATRVHELPTTKR
jgi:hypothetical protein